MSHISISESVQCSNAISLGLTAPTGGFSGPTPDHIESVWPCLPRFGLTARFCRGDSKDRKGDSEVPQEQTDILVTEPAEFEGRRLGDDTVAKELHKGLPVRTRAWGGMAQERRRIQAQAQHTGVAHTRAWEPAHIEVVCTWIGGLCKTSSEGGTGYQGL